MPAVVSAWRSCLRKVRSCTAELPVLVVRASYPDPAAQLQCTQFRVLSLRCQDVYKNSSKWADTVPCKAERPKCSVRAESKKVRMYYIRIIAGIWSQIREIGT